MTDTPPRMSRGELQTVREYLGMTGEELASRLGVGARTLRAWESGREPIPWGVTDSLEQLEHATDTTCALLTQALEQAGEDSAVCVYRTWADLPVTHQATGWPVRWWRHIAYRAATATGRPIVTSDDDHPGPVIGAEIITITTT